MTHELGPEARALLDAAREGLGPDAAAIQRMRAKIDASIASGAAGAGAAGAGAGAGGLAVKLGAVAVVAALAVGAVIAIVAGRRGEEASEPRLELPAARVEAPVRGPSREVAAPAAPAREGDAEPEIEMAPLIRDEPAKPAQSPRAASAGEPPQPGRRIGQASTPAPASAPAPAAPTPTAPAPAPAAPRRADLAREVVLVDQAMAALRRGEPAAALAAVRVHAAETAGAGQLAEDAAAIEIEALCRLHDPDAGARLAAFDARWPQSAQRSRLTARCP
jgi:hypothetical protein